MEENTPNPAEPVVAPVEATNEADTLREQLTASQLELQMQRFPQASEFQDAIKAKIAGGSSAEDAVISVLHQNGKLTPSTTEAPSFGGSMDTPQVPPQKAPQPGEPGAVEYYRNQFQELEKKGEIIIT